MRRIRFAVVLSLVLAARVLAGPVEDLTRIIREAMATAEPATALLKGFQGLGDIQLSGPEVAKALADAGVPADGPVGQVLPGGATIAKKGSTIEITRPTESTVPLVFDGVTKGHVKLGKKVKLRVQRDGDGVLIDRFDGIQVGESTDSFYDVRRLKFAKNDGKPVLQLTAAWGLFSKTMTYDLPAPKPTPPATQPIAPAASRPNSTGLSDGPGLDESNARPEREGPGVIQRLGGN